MKIEELILPEDFEQIKKGDLVIVEFIRECYPLKGLIHPFKIFLNKHEDNEIILQKKGNIWFNWKIYLNGGSHVVKICKVCP